MSGKPFDLIAEHVSALRRYLAEDDERSLRHASESGRRVVTEGDGIAGLVAAQHNLLGELLRPVDELERERILGRALRCLANSLGSSMETNARLEQSLGALQSVEEQLREQNDDLTSAHQTLEQERVRYQALFDLAPYPYLVTGSEGAIWEANAAAGALLRTSKDLLPGQSLIEFVAEEDQEDFRKRLRALHTGALERVEDWEVRIRPMHAATIPAALTVVAERSIPAGLAGLRWFLRDVTERKTLEDERAAWLVSRTKAKAARRFEFLARASALLVGPLDLEASLADVARLSAAFLRGWCFISAVEPNGSLRQLEVAHVDPRFEELAAKLRMHQIFNGNSDLLPRGPLELESLSPDWIARAADSPEHEWLLRQLGGRAVTILPLRVRERPVGVIALIRTPDSRRYGAANRILFEDLAQRCALALENARLYQEAVAQRDRAEKVNRIKDEFVAILGHELRNPLTPIAGWTRVLKRQPAILQNATLAEGVTAIERNTAALTRLVGECTDLARISEGKFRVDRTPIDLNQIIKAVTDSVQAAAAERELTLIVQLAPKPLMVEGDPMRLEQVMNNLLINALKYTNSGRIRVRTESLEEHAGIEVADTGVGIEPGYLEQIFEPFRQGGTAWLTSKTGLGLGLSIARRIVEMHGGRIWAESAGLGCGSTFRIHLPRALRALHVGSVKEPSVIPLRTTAGIRVLLIEDSPDIRFLMKHDLEAAGHTVLTAVDGNLGLEAVKTTLPDLVISDIKMPQMDGYEFIRVIRSDPALRNTPAIALTGFGTKGEVERAIEAGFDLCLTKPVESDTIEQAIAELRSTKAR